jgi:hypothetical protein
MYAHLPSMPLVSILLHFGQFQITIISVDIFTRLELSVCLFTDVPLQGNSVQPMASYSFKLVLDEDGDNFPTLLGQVSSFRLLECVYFQIVLVWK